MHKRGISLLLTRRDGHIAVKQTSKFTPLNIKAKLAGGLKVSPKTTHFDTRSILKVGFPGQTNICLYLGLKYSFDGLSFLIGMKVGAMKMMFPILILNTGSAVKQKGKSSNGTDPEESDNISVLIGYLVS